MIIDEEKEVASVQNGQYNQDTKRRNPAPATEGETMKVDRGPEPLNIPFTEKEAAKAAFKAEGVKMEWNDRERRWETRTPPDDLPFSLWRFLFGPRSIAAKKGSEAEGRAYLKRFMEKTPEKEPDRTALLSEIDAILAEAPPSRAAESAKRFRAAVAAWQTAGGADEAIGPDGKITTMPWHLTLAELKAGRNEVERKIAGAAMKYRCPALKPATAPATEGKKMDSHGDPIHGYTDSVAKLEEDRAQTRKLRREMADAKAAEDADWTEATTEQRRAATKATLLKEMEKDRKAADGTPIAEDIETVIDLVRMTDPENRPFSETIKGKWSKEEEAAFERFQAWKKEQNANKSAAPEPTAEQAKAVSTPRLSGAADRIYLTVPFADKDRVKAKGAKWDGDKKKWYWPTSAGDMPAVVKGYAK